MRRAIWVCAIDVIKNDLWLGVGTGDGQDALQESYLNRNFVLAGKYNRFNAHNQYLQVAINFGLIGLLSWLGVLIWLLYHQRRNWLLLTLITIFLFSMLTESMLETNKGVLTFSFLTVMANWRFRSSTKTNA
ncbi:MAG: O-antigen ligase family protein [Bacteroidota bacterium]